METLDRTVRAWIALGSGLHANVVIPGNDSGPAPTDPYSTVLLVSDRQIGATAYHPTFDGSTVMSRLIVTVESRWSVQFFRAGSHATARRFRNWAGSPLGRLAALQMGLTLLRADEILQADQVVTGMWEPRATIDLRVGHVHTVEQDIGRIADARVLIDVDPASCEFLIEGE